MKHDPTKGRKGLLDLWRGKGRGNYSSLDIWQPITDAFAVGFVMIAMIVVFMLAGWWLDGYLGSAPIFVLVGICAGIAAGFWYSYRIIMKTAPKQEIEKQDECKNTTDSGTESSE